MRTNFLQYSSSTILRSTFAEENFVGHTIHFIIIVPSQFLSSFDGFLSEKRNPRESHILSVDENTLHKEIRAARVLENTREVMFCF